MRCSISLRRATEEDAGAMARLAGELGYALADETTRRSVQAIVASAMDLLLVAEDAITVPA
jgi:hypothetical protein